jgi:NAD(P)-dependent dehydrogenase (short-subunit alcohol dehydrogenase family)
MLDNRSNRLDGKITLVTGAAGLLGRSHTAALAAAGATVIALDINDRALTGLVESCPAPASIVPAPVDITDPAAVSRLAASLKATYGRLDVLVNNAAIDPKFDEVGVSKQFSHFVDFPLEEWSRSLSVNLTGMFLVTQAMFSLLEAAEGASVINVSSIYGIVGPDQRIYLRPGQPPVVKPVTYSVTKSAVLGFTRYMATYCAGRGIRVNTLTPGGVWTDHDEEFTAAFAAKTVLGRMARPEEITSALVFLASNASSYMTGSNLVVDGGWTAW